jgi:4-alpha-glucanotransferase
VEDLGLITPDVVKLRDELGYPGMKVLQFAFDSGPDNPYLPHNYHHHCVVYTGTHDNDTTSGWFAGQPAERRQSVLDYLGMPGDQIAWDLIRLALMSVADLAIVPFQDVLGLGSEARFNRPGQAEGNWEWRFRWDQVHPKHLEQLGHLTQIYGRTPQPR